MNRQQVEKLFAACLLRAEGEPREAPLDRINSLAVWPSASDIQDRQARLVSQLVFKYAKSERSVSPKLAATELGIPEVELLKWVTAADLEAINTYASILIQHQKADLISSAAQQASDKTRIGNAQEALDELSDQIAALQAANEDRAILGLHEATENFVKWYEKYQQDMQSKKVRWSFQHAALDDKIPYVFPGHAILATAGSKVGKSSQVQQWFDYNIRRGLRGIFFHFEDSPEVMGIKRTAREMISVRNEQGNIVGLSQKDMLGQVLSPRQMDMIRSVNQSILTWKDNGKFVNCAGWTMEQCMRVVWRYKEWLDFFVIDYVGKEFFGSSKLRNYGGPYGAAAYDAELIKTTADKLGKIAVVVQQEHEGGGIYGTKQTWQKFQVWISLSRDRDPLTQKLSGTHRDDIIGKMTAYDGSIVVKNANMGETGAIGAWFYPEFGLWAS